MVRGDFTSKRVIRQPKPVKVAILGPGEIFGDYEAFNSKDEHEFSVMCQSIKGQVLIFERSEFIKKVASSSYIHQQTIAKSKDKCSLYEIQAFDVVNLFLKQKKKLKLSDRELHP